MALFLYQLLKLTKHRVTQVPLSFVNLYSLVPKIEICPKYFFGQKIPKAAIVVVGGTGNHLGMQIHT